MLRKKIIACFGVILLFLGASIYLLLRPTSLLMFHWADKFGLMTTIDLLRFHYRLINSFNPPLIVYSMPFALWVLSYLLITRIVWWGSPCRLRYMWFWCVPLISVIAEVLQKFEIVPGTFDIIDLITLLIVTTIGLGIKLTNAVRRTL